MINPGSVHLFNVGSVEPVAGLGDGCLMRIPASVRNSLNPRAKLKAMDPVGCEVRFVTDAPSVEVHLSSSALSDFPQPRIRIFRGNLHCHDVPLNPGTHQTIRIHSPSAFLSVQKKALNKGGFSSDVWRLAADRGGVLCLHGVDAFGREIRPPRSSELPKIDWLAYGSSITNSSLDGYPHIAARLLNISVQNKGLGGSCHYEPQLIDWMAEGCNWNFATLEIGVNMRSGYTQEEFTARIRHALERFADTGRPVVAITVFPNCRTQGIALDTRDLSAVRESEFNAIVKKEVDRLKIRNLHFVEGKRILSDFSALSGDLLHPSGYGHVLMGMNLARILRRIIPDLRNPECNQSPSSEG
jgi:hypothetical protein